MKRVSFEIAKALKEAGYPQYNHDELCYYKQDGGWILFGKCQEECYNAPYYMEVWLWLWREKKECINIMTDIHEDCRSVCANGEVMPKSSDPEEAIIAAIEYLVKNKLLV